MKIVHLVPGAGSNFTCENCIRDNTLANELLRMDHDVIVVPLYLPLNTSGFDITTPAPIFFGGVNVYLQQIFKIFRKSPQWIDRLFDAPFLLNWAASLSRSTQAKDLSEMTLSMLRGEEGRQAKELDRLVQWLTNEKPDVIHLSNALLLGMVKHLKRRLGVPIVCTLQDEDIFLDLLPEPDRAQAWKLMSQRANDIDAFISVSHYYREIMRFRLQIPQERLFTVYNGIRTEAFEPRELLPDPPVIGYMEKLSFDKGLHILIDAFILLREKSRFANVKLHIAGGKTAEDEGFVRGLKKRLKKQGLLNDVELFPDLNPSEKIEFLKQLSILSVPAVHREAFGGYILEALAAGVPVIQPAHGAFPELLENTGGGVLFPPNDAAALAVRLEKLLLDPQRMKSLGEQGRMNVLEKFHCRLTAEAVLEIYQAIGGTSKQRKTTGISI